MEPPTRTQREKSIKDSVELFTSDTLKGGAKKPELAKVLCENSGADFAQNSLLATYRPDLLHLPTTNGEHCTGDAIKMGEAIGEKTMDLE